MPHKDESSFFQTKQGFVVAGVIIFALLAGVVWLIKANFGQSSAAQLANKQEFVCSKTGKGFSVTLEAGMSIPVKSPYSGENTGYPAELCYWTADGQMKDKPDPVLMNSFVGKPEPTFCPVCKRLVVHRNPKPAPGGNPPPTEDEYRQRHASSGQQNDRATVDH
jgi:hypothetical protein